MHNSLRGFRRDGVVHDYKKSLCHQRAQPLKLAAAMASPRGGASPSRAARSAVATRKPPSTAKAPVDLKLKSQEDATEAVECAQLAIAVRTEAEVSGSKA